MKRLSLLAALLATACNAGSCSTVPVGFFGACGSSPFDLTGVLLPACFTATRTGGTIYPARSASTAATITGGDVAEDRGDETCDGCVAGGGSVGSGHWTWPTWTQDVATPNSIASNGAWSKYGAGRTITDAAAVAPNGTSTAVLISDSSASDYVYVYRNYGAQDVVGSLWVKDALAPPTLTGGLTISSNVADLTFSPSSAWKRISKHRFSGTYGIVPAGFTTAALTNAPTGGVYVWAPSIMSALGGFQDLPSSDGTASGALTMQIKSTGLGQLVRGGDVDIDGYYELDGTDCFSTAGTNGVVYVFSMDTPQGAFSLRQQGGVGGPVFTFAAKGSDLLTETLGGLFGPAELHWRVVYKQSTGVAYLQIDRNGAGHQPVTGVAASGAIGTPTGFYLGSNAGASVLPRKHTYQLRTGSSSVDIFGQEVVFLGDSIIADYSSIQSLTATFVAASSAVYTIAQSRSRPGIATLAHAGDTVANQKDIWDASTYKGRSTVHGVVIHVGVNDLSLNTGKTSAALISEIQGLVNDIHGSNPTAKIIVEYLYPCKQRLDAVNVALWPQVAVVNAGISALANVDNVLSSTYALLDDGNYGGTVGNLRAAADIDILDHIHTNYWARTTIQAPAYLAALQAVGVLP